MIQSKTVDICMPKRNCDPFAQRALSEKILFYRKVESEECYDRLIQASKSEDLLTGEILFLEAMALKKRVSVSYFRIMHGALHTLIPFYDTHVRGISDDDVTRLLADVSDNRKRFVWSWIHLIRKSEFLKERSEFEYGLLVKKESHPSKEFDEFLKTISFDNDFCLRRNSHFSTVFKYWLWINYKTTFFETEEPSRSVDETVRYKCCRPYQYMERLHNMPYWKVRPTNVLECMDGLTTSMKDRIRWLYRQMDMFAFEQDLTQVLYSKKIKAFRNFESVSEPGDVISQNDIENLWKHNGEIETDFALAVLYTGLNAFEICRLKQEDIDEKYIHVLATQSNISEIDRDIPLHKRAEQPLRHAIRYSVARNAETCDAVRCAYAVRELIGEATERYCYKRYSTKECRYSFTARLRDAGAMNAIVDYVKGVRLKAFRHKYAEPTSEQIYNAVINIR